MKAIPALDVFAAPLGGVNLIEASAGTGKTWTICGLYLRLLLERRCRVHEILVVTFTKAATAELRERIRTRMLELLAFLNADSPATDDPFILALSADLMQRIGMRKHELTERLELALYSFDEASIFTIHGFCQRALADQPFAAGLPMHTELVESDQEYSMQAVHDFWRRHVADAAVSPELARHIFARGDTPEKYGKLLARRLAKPLARLIWPADIDAPLPAAAQLDQPYRLARTMWRANKSEITTLLAASLASLNGQTYKSDCLAAAAADWDTLCQDEAPFAVIGKKAHLFRQTVIADQTKKNCQTPVHSFFAHAEAYLSLREAFDTALARARLRLLERLFAEAALQLQTLKRSRQVVSFSDMLTNVHERLQNPDYPWLAASIRIRFPAALIDEFQDTDPLQLAIFQKIYPVRQAAAPSAATGPYSVPLASTDDSVVFLVGDPKQAIYSFRHADLHSYLRATRWATRQWSLAFNQRSSTLLLSGLNRLFEGNASAFVLPEVRYHRVGYGAKPRPEFIDRTEARAPLQIWRLPDHRGEGLPKARAKGAAVEATAAEIARLIQAGMDGRIMLAGRNLRSGDIAVLVRSRALGGEVKRALTALRVGAVELSRDSIYGSPEAQDWETVLTAIAAPTRDGLLRAALATDLFGRDAAEIERIAAAEALLSGWISQFTEYRDLWLNRGFGLMYRRIFADQAVARRLLGRPDGERRLTNCLHLGEALQQAAESHPSPEALLQYLTAARQDENPLDAAQLRLESDQDLVQIVTIHTCKGLEYPMVFCPFLCDGGTRFGGTALEGHEYHDAELQPVIDFNQYERDDAALAMIKAAIKREQSAETVRLLYVALTRAVHRCYLVAGPYQTRSPKAESARSMLNWLVAGQGISLEQWLEGTLSIQSLDAAWRTLAQAGGGAIGIDPLPQSPGSPVQRPAVDISALTTPAPPGRIAGGWRFGSYSGLSYGANSEQSATDHDARAGAAETPLQLADVAAADILRFPRGAAAGDCIHAVFERIDFTDRGGWETAIATALEMHPQTRAGDPNPVPATLLVDMLLRLVEDVTAASLRPGLRLASVPMHRRLTELEFNLPVPSLSASALNAALRRLGYEVPSLTFGSLVGYLKGFIDLVFEHRGQFFILDWKSNHLGYRAVDYGDVPVARAMADHAYHLQYLLYTVAVDRYLRMRVQDYRYGTHFGGVLYLFVRGVRAAWSRTGAMPGVFFHRPPEDDIRLLNRLLDTPTAAAIP